MNKEDIIKVIDSFKTFDQIYESLKDGDYSVISRKCGTNEYPEINWLIEYFLENEEYEKCEFLRKIELKKVTNEQLNKELDKLKLM